MQCLFAGLNPGESHVWGQRISPLLLFLRFLLLLNPRLAALHWQLPLPLQSDGVLRRTREHSERKKTGEKETRLLPRFHMKENSIKHKTVHWNSLCWPAPLQFNFQLLDCDFVACEGLQRGCGSSLQSVLFTQIHILTVVIRSQCIWVKNERAKLFFFEINSFA